jgi:hypothetical protein
MTAITKLHGISIPSSLGSVPVRLITNRAHVDDE